MSSYSSWDLCWGSETQVLPWRCRWRGERIHRLIWRNVFGLMAIPVVVTLAVFLALVRDDRAVGPRRVSKGDRTVRWWHAAVALIRHRSHVLVVLHLWRDVWRICRTVQCPAAVFSRLLWNESPLRRDDDGALWSCRKRHATSRCGYGADRISGLASLRVVLPLIVLIVASIGYSPPLEWCVPFMIAAVRMMGFGNGAVFQIVSPRFHSQIGLASGLVGAAGGLGGFSCRLCGAP